MAHEQEHRVVDIPVVRVPDVRNGCNLWAWESSKWMKVRQVDISRRCICYHLDEGQGRVRASGNILCNKYSGHKTYYSGTDVLKTVQYGRIPQGDSSGCEIIEAHDGGRIPIGFIHVNNNPLSG